MVLKAGARAADSNGMPWQRPPATSDAGLSLVEVMVAMVLFLLGSLSLLSVLVSSMDGTFDNRARLAATNLAAADLDAARKQNYFSLATAATREETVDGRVYRITRQVQPVMASGASSACIGSGSARQLHKLVSTRVEASWRDATTKPVRADTLVRAPLYDLDSPLGAVGFRVENRDGAPIPNLQVSASTLTRTTDPSGCAFFDGLTPGPVTVTVQRPLSVTRAGSTSLTKTVQVVKGQITADSLRVDAAVTITATTMAFSGGVNGTTQWPSSASPSGPVMTIAASDRNNVARITYASKAVATGVDTTWSAFPARGGYAVWLGTCLELGHSDAEPGPTAPARVVLPLSPVQIRLRGDNDPDNFKAQSKTVRATGGAGTCGEVLTFPVVTTHNCIANSEGSNTCDLELAVPTGTWTFQVVGSTKHLTTRTVSLKTRHTWSIDVSGPAT